MFSPEILSKNIEVKLAELNVLKDSSNNKKDKNVMLEFIESGTILLVALKETYQDKGLAASLKKMAAGKTILENAESYLNDVEKIIHHYQEVGNE